MPIRKAALTDRRRAVAGRTPILGGRFGPNESRAPLFDPQLRASRPPVGGYGGVVPRVVTSRTLALRNSRMPRSAPIRVHARNMRLANVGRIP